MRRSKSKSEDSDLKKPLNFTIGDSDDESPHPVRPPPPPVFNHIRETHSPPNLFHIRIARLLFHFFPRLLLCLFFILFIIALLPGGWRVALCSANIIPPPALRSGENITLISHRGCEFPYPENSLHALRLGARETGFIEFDISLSSDGHVVLMHDNTLDRTTNGSGVTCTRSWDYMKSLKLKMPERDPRGRIAQAKFCSVNIAHQSKPCVYRVPTLEQVFDDMPDGTRFVIDIKSCYADGINVTTPLCSNCTILMERTRIAMEKYFVKPEQVTFTSNQAPSLAVFQAGFPEVKSFSFSVAQEYSHFKPSTFRQTIVRGNFSSVAMYVGLAALRPDFVRIVRSTKRLRSDELLDVFAWTIRTDLDYRLARCAGISSLVVAEPDRMKKRLSMNTDVLIAAEEIP